MNSTEEKPKSLPESFTRIWRLLSRANARIGSRRKLSRKLRVSTHTLQRILVDGDVPDLTGEVSPQLYSSWVRTITRIALGEEEEPSELLRSAGIVMDDRVRRLMEKEMERIVPDSGNEGRDSSGIAPEARAASLLLHLMESDLRNDGDETEKEKRRVISALRDFLVAEGQEVPERAGEEDLESGSYCRSCMTSLNEDANRGRSGEYCRWCSDQEGELRPREQVHEILTRWIMRWQRGVGLKEASRRAMHYMEAMPAWSGSGSAVSPAVLDQLLK